jgi:hypothetical protein
MALPVAVAVGRRSVLRTVSAASGQNCLLHTYAGILSVFFCALLFSGASRDIRLDPSLLRPRIFRNSRIARFGGFRE